MTCGKATTAPNRTSVPQTRVRTVAAALRLQDRSPALAQSAISVLRASTLLATTRRIKTALPAPFRMDKTVRSQSRTSHDSYAAPQTSPATAGHCRTLLGKTVGTSASVRPGTSLTRKGARKGCAQNSILRILQRATAHRPKLSGSWARALQSMLFTTPGGQTVMLFRTAPADSS